MKNKDNPEDEDADTADIAETAGGGEGAVAVAEAEQAEYAGGDKSGFLIPQDRYLEAGVHIGTKVKTGPMRSFIYMRRNDGLYVLDIKKTDERIRNAGKILAQYEPEQILVTASRIYSGISGANFCKVTGANLYPGRFIPGVLTNPSRLDFMEPKVLIISDPRGEREAIIEAGKMGIPVVALCDTDNVTKFLDYIVPCNNKGRKSLAMVFYLLAREYMVGRGLIASYSEFKYPLRMFSEDDAVEEIKERQKTGATKEGIQEAPKPLEVVLEEVLKGKIKEEIAAEGEAKPADETPVSPEDLIKKKNIPIENPEEKKED